MKRWVGIIALSLIVCGVSMGCSDSGHHKPQSPSPGTEQVFEADEMETAAAVKSAFNELRYHNTMLEPAAGSQSLPDLNATNGFLLLSTTEPLSTIGQKLLPYFADFHIAILHVESNQTKVMARTVRARVIDGREVNVHGGWAHHFREISPVPHEEAKVLLAISAALASNKNSHATSSTFLP